MILPPLATAQPPQNRANAMKNAVLNALQSVGAFALFRILNRRKAFILTYHRFSRTESERATSACAFAEQLSYVSTHYHVVPLSVLADSIMSGSDTPTGLAAITIDDGYRDTYDIAFPLLRRYNLPATVFVITDFIDQKTWLWTDKLRYAMLMTPVRKLEQTINGSVLRFELDDRSSRLKAANQTNAALKTLPDGVKEEAIGRVATVLGVELPELPPDEFAPVSWEQAREMDAAGVEIGSHTVTHPILTNIDEERMRYELRESKSRLEGILGRRVDLFCYPNGDYDARVRGEVKNAGYKSAVTVLPGFNDKNTDVLTLRRIHTERDMVHFVQSTSGFEELKNRGRALVRIGTGGSIGR